jgi:trigger factor
VVAVSRVERLGAGPDGVERVRLTVEVPDPGPAGPGPDGAASSAYVATVSGLVHRALAEHGLVPLRLPEVEVGGGGDGLPATARTVVELRPAIGLPELAAIGISLPELGGDPDGWVEWQLARMRAEYVDLTPVEREARTGDVVRLGLRAVFERGDDGDGDEGGAGGAGSWEPADGVDVELGAGGLLDGLDEALVGLRAGQETTVRSRVPSGPDEGREALVTVSVQAVLQAREPELGDELAAAATPHATLAELRTALRARLERERRADLLIVARDTALAAVVEAAGLDPEQELSRHIVLDALADAQGIRVTVEELRDVVAFEMGRSGVSARTFRKHLARDGVAARLHEYARREKALVHLLRSVVIRDADGNVVSFDELAGEDRHSGTARDTAGDAASAW